MNDKILDRIKKLIRHERSAREIGSIAEAEAFAARLQQYIDEYNINLSEIGVDEEQSTVTGERTDINIRDTWRRRFCQALCEMNGVFLVYEPPFAYMSGSEIDKAIVTEMYDYFTELALAMCDKASAVVSGKSRRAYRHAYLTGFVVSLGRRLRDRQKQSFDAVAASQTTNALVFIGNKLAKAEATALDHFGKLINPGSYAPPSDFGGFQKGQQDGNNVALTTKTMGHRKMLGAAS